jgi:exosome complex component MTR3
MLNQSAMPKEIWLDPTLEEAKEAQGTLTLAFVPALEIATNVWQSGQMSIEEVERVSPNYCVSVSIH